MAGWAQAQEPALEEIVITGSRISNPNATSSSPILGVTSEDIKLQGIADAGDLIDNLPQHITTNVDLSNTNNPLTGPGGVATMDLRGLGPQRTLVLIDGQPPRRRRPQHRQSESCTGHQPDPRGANRARRRR